VESFANFTYFLTQTAEKAFFHATFDVLVEIRTEISQLKKGAKITSFFL